MKDSAAIAGAGIALTPMQSWMFYESIPAERPAVSLQQAVVRLDREALAPDRLAAAWDSVAALHPALRASILWRNRARPEQVVATAVSATVEQLDWREMPAEAQERALADFLARDRERGVDVEAAPHWRVTLIRLGEARSVMVWTAHNALIDGTGVGIVLEDLFAVLDTGAPISPPLDTERYLELYAEIGAPPPAAAAPFFADYLDGFEPLGLATSPDRTETGKRADIRTRTLDSTVTAALKDSADRCGGTLRNLVETAWGLLLARWHNAPDLVFGVTGAGRNLMPGGARAAGCFLNTLPRRMRIGRDTTLGEVMGALRDDAEAMRPFEQVPVSEIRRFCNLHGASFLFDTVVMFDRGRVSQLFAGAGGAARGRSAELLWEIDLPLALGFHTEADMRLELEADPTVVGPDRARRMLDHLVRLLTAIAVAHPGTRLRDLDMLGAERDELMTLGTPDAPTSRTGLLDGFATVVARRPDAVAVEEAGTGRRMRYAALDEAATRLAAELQARGAGPGDFIAIHLARSPEYLVALLAVLKTGAAFLPIDPSYPDAVIAHMLEDSGTRLIISRGMETAASGAEVVGPEATGDPATFTPVARDPGGPAYMIYTSGSTGKPKGVVIPDRASAGHVEAAARHLGLTSRDRVYQFISLSFDFSLEEILPTLREGATLVLRSDTAALSGAALLDEIADLGLTVLHLPTAFFHVVADYRVARGAALPGSLRLVNIGGERANPRIVQDWLRTTPGVRLLNGYGPTEAAVTATFHEPGGDLAEGDVPIGRPAGHALVYVAAPDGSLAPRGATGELWVGGVAVGTGYHNLPDKTADVFLDDHFRGTGRVYRTGDRAAWRADGAIDFFGRKDRQVKVRGFRIDLGHVERVLETAQKDLRIFAGVRDAGTPSARLLAWATIAGGASVDIDALNALAEAELPPQMRPRIVVVDAFPRTAGGKVNLAALPDPGQPATPTRDTAPMTELETRLAREIGAVLMIGNVGAEDDFYELGGHSLLAAELVGRIEVNLGHRISVIDLQRHPTARGLAGVLGKGAAGPRNIFPIQPDGTRPPLFGVHILGGAQDRYYEALAAEFGPDQPVLGVTIGALARDKPIGVEETARRYFDEIQTFYPDGPVHLAAVSLGAYFAWELAWLLNEAGRQIGHFALFDADGPDGRDTHSGLARLRANIRTLRHRGLGAVPAALSNRINQARYARISARMKRQAETGARIDIRDGDDFIASNDLAVERYAPKPLAVPVTIYRSNENFFDTEACIRNGLGWASVARAGYEVIDVPGGHLTMLSQPHAGTLARHMARAMGL